MYIYLSKIDKSIIESSLKTLDIDPKDYIVIIKEEECIKTNDLIELVQNLNYKVGYYEEKLEDIENGKEL